MQPLIIAPWEDGPEVQIDLASAGGVISAQKRSADAISYRFPSVCGHPADKRKLRKVPNITQTGVIGSDVPCPDCPACNALTWVITVTE